MKRSRVVVIGGGTGTYVTLQGLKKFDLELTAIVTMMDSGGSSGKLRDELGVLPPGDVRQCIVALSKSSKLLRDMFNYRFESGAFAGHSFGNIFLSTLEKTTGSMKKAISEVGKILRIQGSVVPVTFTKSNLCVSLSDGTRIKGETHIDVVENKEERLPIVSAYLNPPAFANIDALEAIRKANFILIGPGDLYTSIIPNLLVKGVKSAIKASKAKKIFTLNIMTKYGQTTLYSATDHIADLEKYLGKGVLDIVLVNKRKPRAATLAWYQDFDEHPVVDDLHEKSQYQTIRADLMKDVIIGKIQGDDLKRSIIRHDPGKLAQSLTQIMLK